MADLKKYRDEAERLRAEPAKMKIGDRQRMALEIAALYDRVARHRVEHRSLLAPDDRCRNARPPAGHRVGPAEHEASWLPRILSPRMRQW